MIAAIPERIEWLKGVTLQKGNHEDLAAGVCAMEAVAYIAGEPHSDRPSCACPVLSSFMRRWNDTLPDADRAMLKPYIMRVIGTKATMAVEVRRSSLAFDWLAREYTPAWLDVAGLTKHADALRGAKKIVNAARQDDIGPVLAEVLRGSWEALEAVEADYVWGPAMAALRESGQEAARVAAVKALIDDGAQRGYMVRWINDALRNAVLAAPVAALAPVVKKLQASACRLLDRMIAVK